jgi:aryl-alcohol dehydrogenase-like predicted oxidoreductase
LQDNVRSTEIKLDAEDLAALDKVSRLPSEYPGWLLNPSEWPSQG